MMLILLTLGSPLTTTLLEKVIEKGQVINRQCKPNVKARGLLWSLIKTLHFLQQEKEKTGLDFSLIERQT